jgi:hypothetical protein
MCVVFITSTFNGMVTITYRRNSTVEEAKNSAVWGEAPTYNGLL